MCAINKKIIFSVGLMLITILTLCGCGNKEKIFVPYEELTLPTEETTKENIIEETSFEETTTTIIEETTTIIEEETTEENIIYEIDYYDPGEYIINDYELVVDLDGYDYTPQDLENMGVIYWGNWRFTWYSEYVLPGDGLNIPGRWSDGNFVRDENGYICVASSDLDWGTTLDTPWGPARVYDSGCSSGTIDIYTSW